MNRCSACPHTHKQVMPDGPTNARIMVIGEGPGWQEERDGVPFVGKAGQELDNTYLPLAGLKREDVFVTNIVQCRCERNGVDVKPSDSLRDVCGSNHVWAEIDLVKPKLIVLCGATACQWMDASINLELQHGFPYVVGGIYPTTVVPMYHPAAGLHESRFMTPMLEDWERLGKWLRGKWEPPHEQRKYPPVYKLIESGKDWDQALREHVYEYLPIDTESDERKPYSIQFSPAPGRGYMLLVSNRKMVDDFDAILQFEYSGKIAAHNAPYDLDELDKADVYVNSFRDTQQELYHLGNLPQGLKAAVYRVFGFKMTSYDEVVTPHSKRLLEGWLAEALAHASTEMRREVEVHLKTKIRIDSLPHECEAVLRRVMKAIDSDYDPWEQPKRVKGVEKPRLIGREWLAELETAVGRMPRPSIVHAPMADQIQYACGDADWTGRLATWLEHERKRIVQEEWCVA